MPPPGLQSAVRLPLRTFAPSSRPIAPSLPALFASLSLQQNARQAHILARLSDHGASKFRRRVGRGPSSGRGKTAGRGTKGQKAHGHVKSWFQGGQTPLIVARGKKGEDVLLPQEMATVNLDKLQEWISLGRIDPAYQITPKEIVKSGLVHQFKDGIKLLGRGKQSFKTPIDIIVSRASKDAIEAVEAVGGKITTRYYTKQSIEWLLKGKCYHTDKPLPVGAEHVPAALAEARKHGFKRRLPDPTSRKDIEYYRDPAHRGYMSHMLKPGQSPSLFFGVPSDTKLPKQTKPGTQREENSMW